MRPNDQRTSVPQASSLASSSTVSVQEAGAPTPPRASRRQFLVMATGSEQQVKPAPREPTGTPRRRLHSRCSGCRWPDRRGRSARRGRAFAFGREFEVQVAHLGDGVHDGAGDARFLGGRTSVNQLLKENVTLKDFGDHENRANGRQNKRPDHSASCRFRSVSQLSH